MADDNTCNDKCSVTAYDQSDENVSSNSSDYLYITCSPGSAKNIETDGESDDEDQFVDTKSITDSRPETCIQHEISEKLYRLKMENEFLKAQMSQVIEIFDDEDCATDVPLVQVFFSHHFLALNYKSDLEAYLCSLLTSDKGSAISDSERSDSSQSDGPVPVRNTDSPKDLFILENSIDDSSCCSIPLYDNKYEGTLDSKPTIVPKSKLPPRSLPSCFNCLGSHRLSECPEEHNKEVIAVNKKNYFIKQASRSIPVDTRRTRLFTAGVISEELRKALGLESNQLPLHIYHMRLLGYPPGWMKEAEVHDSELKMYDSEGNLMLDDAGCQNPDNILPKVNDNKRNTEIQNPDNGLPKVKYDPSLLIDYPGFNTPTPIGFVDESKKLGMPGIQFHHLRCVTELKMASPGKMPYRKRKLPSSAEMKRQRLDTSCLEDMETESLDMEIESLDNGEGRIIDSDDDDAKLCQFIPPLPPEKPICVPSPPPLPIPPPTFQEDNATTKEQSGTQREVTDTEVERFEKLPEEGSIANKDHEVLNKKEFCKEKKDELTATSLKDLEETKQKLLSELRNLWVKGATKDAKKHTSDYKDVKKHTSDYKDTKKHTSDYKDAKKHTSDYKDAKKHTSDYKDAKKHASDYKDSHHREYKGACQECKYTLRPGSRDSHNHPKKDKKRKKKKGKKQVSRLIVMGDCTCNKLQFDDFSEKYHVEVVTGDHWKLQTAIFHLKTKDLIKGNEILIVHLGINDLLLKENCSLNEIKKYAKRFIEHTVKQVKFLIISAILPSTFLSTTVNHKIQCANFFIRELCKNEGVSFLNARKAFMTDGKLDKEFFQADNFALSSKGNKMLSRIFCSCFEGALFRIMEQKKTKKQKKKEKQHKIKVDKHKETEREVTDKHKIEVKSTQQQEREGINAQETEKDTQEKDSSQEQSFIEWFG